MVPSGNHLESVIIDDVYRVFLDAKSRFNIKAKDIYLEGSSLGGAIALWLLKKFSGEFPDEIIASLLLKAAPLDMYSDLEDSLKKELVEFDLNYDDVFDLIKKSWNQRDILKNIKAHEVKLIHGELDDVVPISHTEEFEAAFKELKVEKIIVPGEAHAGFDLSKYQMY